MLPIIIRTVNISGEPEIRNLHRQILPNCRRDYSIITTKATIKYLVMYKKQMLIREAAKKVFFFGTATKALTSPSLELRGHLFWGISLELQKKVIFSYQSGPTFPPLSGRATKKKYFFCGFP